MPKRFRLTRRFPVAMTEDAYRRLKRFAAEAGLAGRFAGFSHHALSDDVAEPARQAGVHRLAVAARPDESHLIDTLPPPA